LSFIALNPGRTHGRQSFFSEFMVLDHFVNLPFL